MTKTYGLTGVGGWMFEIMNFDHLCLFRISDLDIRI